MSDTARDWLTILGFFATVVGLVWAIVQVHKTRNSVVAAEKAMTAARSTIQGNVFRIEAVRLTRTIDLVKTYIRGSNVAMALVFLDELYAGLIRTASIRQEKGAQAKRLKQTSDLIAELTLEYESAANSNQALHGVLAKLNKALSDLTKLLNETWGESYLTGESK